MRRHSVSGFVLAAVCGGSLLFSACNQTEPGGNPGSPEVVFGRVDSVRFWPPTLRYARTHDTLILVAHNYTRVHDCAVPLENGEGGWSFRSESSGEYFRFRVALYTKPVNMECDPDPGRDSSFRFSFPTEAGRRLYLQTPDQELNDSVLFVGSAGSAVLHAFEHVRAGANDTLSAQGRFTFRDSTAGHPSRTIVADSLGTCEILQAASFERRGDTLAVRVRTLLADASIAASVPACAGPYADTLEVAPRLYRFP